MVRYNRPDTSCSLSLLQCRSYSAPGKEPSREDSNSSASSSQPDAATWVTILESTAQAPFLKQRLPDPESALRRAFTLFYQVILSLSTVGNPEAASHLLLVSCNHPLEFWCHLMALCLFSRHSKLPQFLPLPILDVLVEQLRLLSLLLLTTYPPFRSLLQFVKSIQKFLAFTELLSHCLLYT